MSDSDKDKQVASIEDTEGWAIGLKAVLKGAFGTDMEVRLKAEGVEKEIQRAQEEVKHMTEGAAELLRTLADDKKDPVQEELINIIRNI